jgi:tRNA-dihydrouridine synthase A
MSKPDRRISVAPMMDWTDRHCRYLHRLVTPNALLYTEMVHTNALIHGNVERHLYFREEEQPVALQLGGSDPKSLAQAAVFATEYGYREINLNCGCPSERVQKGNFGACLMDEPKLVAECIAAMRDVTHLPVTIKTRLGIDDQDSYDYLRRFIDVTHAQGGCEVYILHARKAWLKGLSPKENREIPPLDWDRVHRIKRDYPHLEILINGGFDKVDTVMAQFLHVDGVMIGRKAYHDPFFLNALERALYPNAAQRTREDVVRAWLDYMRGEHAKGTKLKQMTRHALGLFYGQPHSKAWKHALSEAAKSDAMDVIDALLSERKA